MILERTNSFLLKHECKKRNSLLNKNSVGEMCMARWFSCSRDPEKFSNAPKLTELGSVWI